MASIATDAGDGVRVGRVFGRALDVMRANPVATLGLSLLLTGPQRLLIAIAEGVERTDPSTQLGVAVALIILGVLGGVGWLIVGGGLVQAMVAHDQGRAAVPREMLLVGLRRCLPLLAVYLLYLLGVWLGMIFLIIPGMILGVRWGVAMPAVVAERTGVTGALGRSAELTRGARWTVFGTMLLTGVIYLLGLFAIMLVAGAGTWAFSTGPLNGAAVAMSLPHRLLQILVETVMIVWLTLVGASLFVELRTWKDGPDADRLADIFA